MQSVKEKMIYSAFIGDALSLGVHWIYSSETIASRHGKITGYIDPSENQYHNMKKTGEQTHYGDQMMILLESICENNGFDAEKFSLKWQNMFKNYKGYFDGATRTTLANVRNGEVFTDAGSNSNDLAGAARIAPLIYVYHDSIELLVKYSREQTMLTHRDPHVIDAAEFFARTAVLVLEGEHPADAVKKISHDYFRHTQLDQWVTTGLEKKNTETVKTLNAFGLSCHIEHSFPGVIQVISHYENNLADALSECIAAGGDNAARAITVGMILGASASSGALPYEWIDGLKASGQIEKLLKSL